MFVCKRCQLPMRLDDNGGSTRIHDISNEYRCLLEYFRMGRMQPLFLFLSWRCLAVPTGICHRSVGNYNKRATAIDTLAEWRIESIAHESWCHCFAGNIRMTIRVCLQVILFGYSCCCFPPTVIDFQCTIQRTRILLQCCMG